MNFDEYYKAFIESDPAFEGRFFTGVRTTGIFCRTTCRARKPKRENVEFFASTAEALAAGYRPCKICHPLVPHEPVPAMILELITETEENPAGRISDYNLRERGLDPDTVRRWFKKHHGLTFQAYQRARRLSAAFGLLREGSTVAEAAFSSGYESLSGFGESFKKAFGTAPASSGEKKIISLARLDTPLGTMTAGAVEEGLCLLEFSDRPALETELKDIRRLLGGELLPAQNRWLSVLQNQLDEYFAGKRQNFEIPLVYPGSPFQRSVWEMLGKIPYGRTVTYKFQAEQLGCPHKVRAVARANGQNRLALVIPCHRVIGSDGNLTGYGGGLWRKKWLLDLEQGKLRG